MKLLYTFALLPVLFSCTAVSNPPTSTNKTATQQSSAPKLPTLSKEEKLKVGKKIWQNESAGKITGLTHWNDGEQFPSMGIGHFIWYPKNYKGKFVESFPNFVQYARNQKTNGATLFEPC